MEGRLQDGIYYLREPHIGNSLGVLFLRATENTNAFDIGNTLEGLWVRLKELKKGIIKELDVNPNKRSSGNLSVLFGYGPKIFLVDGIAKTKPINFDDRWMFREPNPNGGGPILNESRISYADDLNVNHALSDHIIIQFISDTEFHTSRALVETWKELRRLHKKTEPKISLRVSAYYSGFQSVTNRSLIGFHDGVANIKSSERFEAIAIKPTKVRQDLWTVNGTYLAFMRISINMESWEKMTTEEQEIMIGRDKETGCPIVGIDKNGKPIIDARCPIVGTYEVTDNGNEYYRDLPLHRFRHLPREVSDKILLNSHIAITSPKNEDPSKYNSSNRIFRQGFEFLESSNSFPGFKTGLNFVSFQNGPEKLFQSLTYMPKEKIITKDQINAMPSLNDFFSVHSAGIFLVPPAEIGEKFPGSSIFFNSTK
jgi:deferrochelatase/peroxidase EfeB